MVALIFAAFHGTPTWALGVLPLGLWFGILAWRTGSLWPGMLCHGFLNGSVSAWQVGATLGLWPKELSDTAYQVGIGLVVACLLVSLWQLVNYKPPAPAEASAPAAGDSLFVTEATAQSEIDSTTPPVG